MSNTLPSSDRLQDGETMVWGKTQSMARDLLAAAEQLGHDVGVVRTVTGGFIVPDDVYDLVDHNDTPTDTPDI